MILELDTTLFDIGEISINQLVFLTLCMNENQNHHQDIHKFLSQISETDIQELIDNNLITLTNEGNDKIYKPTDKLKDFYNPKQNLFDEFYNLFPVYVTRPDGTKGFLRANKNKCCKEYNRIVNKSKVMHEYLIRCLNYEIENKMLTGKIGYLKTMWKWITQREWENVEEEMQLLDNNQSYNYGTGII